MASARSLLTAAVLRTGPKVLGSAGFAAWAARIGRVANLDLATTRVRPPALNPRATVVCHDKILPGVFQAYYADSDVNCIVPAQDVPWAASFVPYYRGFT